MKYLHSTKLTATPNQIPRLIAEKSQSNTFEVVDLPQMRSQCGSEALAPLRLYVGLWKWPRAVHTSPTRGRRIWNRWDHS